ncbi:MAG: DsbA family protein [Paracoccaceae bacterium]
MFKRIAIACAVLVGLTASAAAFEINSMSQEEREIFRQEVRAYLLESPEVLMEAIAILEQRQSTAAAVSDIELVAANADALFSDGYSFVGGNPDGDILMVEFLDYRCAFCKRAHPAVTELIKTDGKIKYIIKEYPILGDQSVLASRFAISVLQNAGDESYAAVHDALMTFRGEISTNSLESLATKLDLNVAQIMDGMNSDAISSIIAENRALAQRMQINGTPGFVIGNQMVRGFMPLNEMQQLVADVRLVSR